MTVANAKRNRDPFFGSGGRSSNSLGVARSAFARGALLMTLVLAIAALSITRPTNALAATAPPSASQTGTELRTEHYDLYIEGLDAAETGRMLEQLHAQLSQYFGCCPQGRLSVALYATRERWAAAIAADGQTAPYGGGYYAPATRKAYAWVQPSAYFTRHVLLHEATHQFHWLTSTDNQFPSANWYTEGLAEYFAMHNWDGQRLQTGTIPSVTLEDYPAKALRNFVSAGGDLARMLPHAGRPESWAMVHFLVNKYPAQFRQLSAGLDRRVDPQEAWQRAFGRDIAGFSQEYRQWVASHAQPWEVVWVAWQQRGDSIESDCQNYSMTVLKAMPDAFAVGIHPETKGGMAGLVFAYQSPTDFHILQVIGDRKVRILHRTSDAWQTVSEGDLQPSKGDDVLALNQDGISTSLWANGIKIATLQATGRVGLSAEGGRTLFKVRGLP